MIGIKKVCLRLGIDEETLVKMLLPLYEEMGASWINRGFVEKPYMDEIALYLDLKQRMAWRFLRDGRGMYVLPYFTQAFEVAANGRERCKDAYQHYLKFDSAIGREDFYASMEAMGYTPRSARYGAEMKPGRCFIGVKAI